MANTKVTGDLIASLTIATGNIADNAVTSDKISGITTAHITEGANLYYTDARADARITAATTSDLSEGTNLYYTDARARDAVSVSGNALSYNSSTGVITSNFEESPTFTGNVGIGAAASDGNLHVRKTGINTGITNVLMNANFADGSNGTGLSIGYRTDETTAVLAARTATGNIAFYSYDGGWSESMRIKNNGNVGIGTASPIGKTDIFVGASGYTNNITTLPVGTWSFANGSGSNSYPSLVSKSNATGTGMTLVAATDDGAPNGMDFNIRKGDNTDFSTLTTSGFTFSRFGTVLTTILRNGNVGIGTTNPLALLSIGSGSLTDGNIPVQISTSGGTSERWFGVNKNGSYGLLMGYLEGGTIGNAGTGAYIRNITEDPLYFMVSNSDLAMTIISNKNVGIGTTSPTTHLEVIASQSNSSIRAGGLEMQSYAVNNSWYAENLYYNGGWRLRSNGYATQMYMQDGKITFNRFVAGNAGDFLTPYPTMILNSNGNVGIGTTSPDANLQVNRNTSTANLFNFLDVVANFGNENPNPGNHYPSGIRIYQGSGTMGSGLAALNIGVDTNSATSGSQNTATIETPNGMTQGLRLSTRDSSAPIRFNTDSTERMRIDSSGNVGIGTDSPDVLLQLRSNINTIPANTDFAMRSGKSFRFLGDGDGNADYGSYIEAPTKGIITIGTRWVGGDEGGLTVNRANVGIGATSPGANLEIKTLTGGAGVNTLRLNTNFGGGNAVDINPFITGINNGGMEIKLAGSQKLVMLPNGDVGIGETSPAEKLEVNGNIKAGDTTGKFFTNVYTATTASFADTFSSSGAGLWEYTIRINPNPAGSGSYVDFYYGKVGVGSGWNGSNVTDYIWYQEDQTAPRTLYPSGGGDKTISWVMVSGGSEVTNVSGGTTVTIRVKGFGGNSYNQNVNIYLRRLA
jgi:hypothetical protein